MKKRIIWSNVNIDSTDWKDSYLEAVEANEWDEDTESDDNLWKYIDSTLAMHLDDERMNLNVSLDGRILVIADLGLWDGRRQGLKILSGNVNCIFEVGEEYTEWYSDGHNIKASATHHDGTNFYEFRVIREDRNIERLLNAIYNGEEITRRRLNYYTKSLHPYVAKVYGW